MHIGLLEDDPDQAALLELWLQEQQHSVRAFVTTSDFIAAAARERFDACIIDWMLPDGTGADVLRWLRRDAGQQIPVIVVTMREDEATVVAALGAGADDYVVKPPKPRELLARLQAVARRTGAGSLPVLRLGEYEVDVSRHLLSIGGAPVTLTQKEFDLAVYLFQNPDKLLSRDHLLNRIWGVSADVDTRTVDTHVSRLRRKLKLDGGKGWKLVPIYGFGYRFERASG